MACAGIISIAIGETVFWVASTSELLYYLGTGEWIDIFTQEEQIKFLAFTAGWGALGGVIAQYRTVLTAAAMTPWVDANIVKRGELLPDGIIFELKELLKKKRRLERKRAAAATSEKRLPQRLRWRRRGACWTTRI